MTGAPSTTSAAQTDAGRSKEEILRKLKRAISREIYRLLTSPAQLPTGPTSDRPDRPRG